MKLKFLVIIFTVFCFIQCSKNNENQHSESQLTNVDSEIDITDKKFTSPIKWNYSIYKTKNSDESHILYYFHGHSGDSKTWLNSHAEIRNYWNKNNIASPIVVAISFGPKWFMVKKNKSEKSGLLEFFWKNILPSIENQQTKPVLKRSIMGFSMGGFNASQVFLSKPKMFHKVVLVTPAIYNFTPFSKEEVINSFIERTRSYTTNFKNKIKLFFTGADRTTSLIYVILNAQKEYLPDQKSWQLSSPFSLVDKVNTSSLPEIYISCGNKDEYGFFETSKLFANSLKKNSFKVNWHEINGGHNSIDSTGVASFITK